MLIACAYCGRVHAKDFDCGKLPRRQKYSRDTPQQGRYTGAFKRKSKEIKERSLYLCAVCAEQGRLNSHSLEVHHIVPIRDAPELLCEDENLICLCQSCHRRAERGEIDAEELRRLARLRDEKGAPPGAVALLAALSSTTSPPTEEEKFPK